MKKILICAFLLAFTLSLTACNFDTDTGSIESKATTEKAQEAEKANEPKDGEGTLGDYSIKILKAKKGKDYQKKPVLIVTYKFTNNGDEPKSFTFATSAKAYQDGVECEKAYVVDGVDTSKGTADIKKGASIEVSEAYKLSNQKSDVEVEVKELISFGNDVVKKTFSIK